MKKMFSSLKTRMGIDLGTANTRIYIAGRGLALNEPSVLVFNQKTNEVLAAGREAAAMAGRTPGHLIVSRPLAGGVISDFELAEEMLKTFFNRAGRTNGRIFRRPEAVITVPCGTTDVERKAVEDIVREAGGRRVYLAESPLAAAVGSRLPIFEAVGNIIVDIGAGASEVAIISLGGIVQFKSLKVGGQRFNEEIIKHVRDKHRLLVGEPTAEEIKLTIGSARPISGENLEMAVRGRDLSTGLPKEIEIANGEISRALEKPLEILINAIQAVIENAPPEIAADIYGKNIWLAGGSAQLRGLTDVIAEHCGVPVFLVDDPATASVRGTGLIVEDLDKYKDILFHEEAPSF